MVRYNRIGDNGFGRDFKEKQNQNWDMLEEDLGKLNSPAMTNMISRGSYIVFGAITDKKITGTLTNAVVTISTTDIFIFHKSGTAVWKVNAVKDLVIPHWQAAYVNLEEVVAVGANYNVLTTKVSFTSIQENGSGGFSEDKKIILCTNYLGETGGTLREYNLPRLKEEIAKHPSLINRINRAELIPVGGIRNVEIKGTEGNRDIYIDTELIYLFRGSGQQPYKINPLKSYKIPHWQALYIDLNESPDAQGFYTPKLTKIGFTSIQENGLDAFVNDKKFILCANYDSKLGGILPVLPTIGADGKDLIVLVKENLIQIHIKGSNKLSDRYIRYNFTFSEKPYTAGDVGSNYKVWRIDTVDEVTRTSEYSFIGVRALTRTSEFETAIREADQTDFIGGVHHGDQVMKGEIVMLVDGVATNPRELGSFKANTLEFLMTSIMYRDTAASQGELIEFVDHSRHTTFSKDGVKFKQKLVFKRDAIMTRGYLAMMPISRWRSVVTKDEFITSQALRDYDYLVKDVSVEGFTGDDSANAEKQGVKLQKLWGDTGISCEIEILDRNVWLPNECEYVSNPVDYNKVYFDFCKEHQVKAGDVWEQTHIMRINTSN